MTESAYLNDRSYIQYVNRLTELAVSMFKWNNLPDTVDERFLELILFGDGMALFFNDDVLGNMVLQTKINGPLNVYRIPIQRQAYATNGYHADRTEKDSVIIFNNLIHTNSILGVEMYAKRLYNLDRAIDVNANAQKTPILITCDDSQKLTLKNLYMKYDGNQPVIYGRNGLNVDGFTVLKTDAPYVADKLYLLKTQLWNEALTYLGISNVNTQKKERLITDEVNMEQGDVEASRFSRLTARRQACDKINKMFGTDISVEYRSNFEVGVTDDGNLSVKGGE